MSQLRIKKTGQEAREIEKLTVFEFLPAVSSGAFAYNLKSPPTWKQEHTVSKYFWIPSMDTLLATQKSQNTPTYPPIH